MRTCHILLYDDMLTNVHSAVPTPEKCLRTLVTPLVNHYSAIDAFARGQTLGRTIFSRLQTSRDALLTFIIGATAISSVCATVRACSICDFNIP
jgi:hypothetical protein